MKKRITGLDLSIMGFINDFFRHLDKMWCQRRDDPEKLAYAIEMEDLLDFRVAPSQVKGLTLTIGKFLKESGNADYAFFTAVGKFSNGKKFTLTGAMVCSISSATWYAVEDWKLESEGKKVVAPAYKWRKHMPSN